MTTARFFVTALGATWLALAAHTARAREVHAGLALATQKLLPDSTVPVAQTIYLQAARGEWEAFQVGITASGDVSGISVAVGDMEDENGDHISAEEARLYREALVEVTDPSCCGVPLHERTIGSYPDPLIPFEDPWDPEHSPVASPFSLSAGRQTAVFVDWFVPLGTAPGVYTATVSVSRDGAEIASLAVELEVWELDLPSERTVATSYGFAPGGVRAFHGGPEGPPADGYDDIVLRYYKALHEHRIDPTTIDGAVTFEFDGDTLLPVDWTAYDAAVGPWLDGSLFEDGIGITRFNVNRFRPGHGLQGLTEAQFKAAAAAFAEHLEEKGWWDRAYVYAIDEPWSQGTHGDPDAVYARIEAESALLMEASPLWKDKILVTSPYVESIAEGVGIWCPVTTMYEDWFYFWDPKPGRDLYASRIDQGEELWFYNCNATVPPYAGYDIDTAIGFEPRILKWGAWFEHASGFLYWRTNYWVNDDPWNQLLDVDTFGDLGARNGDGFLLYPGDHDGTAGGLGSPADIHLDGPIESYRLKQVRDGLEDWELFLLAERAGATDYAREQVSRAYKRFGDISYEDCNDPSLYCRDDQPWTLDPLLLEEVRHNVAAKILFLTYPDRYPDPEAIPPEEKNGCACSASEGYGPLFWGLALLAGLGPRRRRHLRVRPNLASRPSREP